MKIKHLKTLSQVFICGICFMLLMTIVYGFTQQPQQQPLRYTLSGELKDFQGIADAINNPDNYSVNQRKSITDWLSKNLVADTTKPKK